MILCTQKLGAQAATRELTNLHVKPEAFLHAFAAGFSLFEGKDPSLCWESAKSRKERSVAHAYRC